jgi:hypothetical protein
MYATVRKYANQPGLAEKFTARRKDIEDIIRTTPGFVAYYMLSTPDGAATVTVCENQSGAEESNRIAADWISKNMANVVTKGPEITAGQVVITTTAQMTGTR